LPLVRTGTPRTSKLLTICVAFSLLRLASRLRTAFESVKLTFALLPGAIANGFRAKVAFPSLTTSVPPHPTMASAGHVRLSATRPLLPTAFVSAFSAMPA
jgi:hypothetical protein